MDTLFLDLRYAFRALRRAPGFATAAGLTLALGIGSATTMFAIANAIVLRPLPFAEAHELVMLEIVRLEPSIFRSTTVSAGDFVDWQAQSQSFDRMAGFHGGLATLVGAGEPESLRTAFVTLQFFETLRVAPAIGRVFGDEASHEVLISASLWRRRRFASEPSIVGRTISLDGSPHRIAGVLPHGFNFPGDVPEGMSSGVVPRVDLWMPATLRSDDRRNSFLHVFARLKPAVSIVQAGEEMSTLAARLAE